MSPAVGAVCDRAFFLRTVVQFAQERRAVTDRAYNGIVHV